MKAFYGLRGTYRSLLVVCKKRAKFGGINQGKLAMYVGINTLYESRMPGPIFSKEKMHLERASFSMKVHCI